MISLRRIPILVLPLALATVSAQTEGDHGFGPVTPSALPDISAITHTGKRVHLRELLQRKRTALQFIFVDCTTVCPLLGNLFAKVDRSLHEEPVQLLSITVNPRADSPTRLQEWLRGFRASNHWLALQLAPKDLKTLLRFFKQDDGPPAAHTLQIFLIDESGRYTARTLDLPTAQVVAQELGARNGPATAAGRQTSAAESGEAYFNGSAAVHAVIGPDSVAGNAARCSGCHGGDGTGGREGKTSVPAIAGSALLQPARRRGGPESRYTQEAFCRTLRTGIDPGGVQLSQVMPRYDMDGRSCALLWSFLTRKQ